MASHFKGVSMHYKLIAIWNLCLVTKRTFQKHKLVKLSNGPGESPARNEPKGKWWTYSDTWKYIWGLRCSLEFSMLNSVTYFHSTAVSNKFKFKFWKIKHAKESHTGNIYSIIHFDAKLKANPSMFSVLYCIQIFHCQCVAKFHIDNTGLHCRSCQDKVGGFGRWSRDTWGFWHPWRDEMLLGCLAPMS